MEKSFSRKVWETLTAVDCSKHIEKKGNLSYLSWAWAWAELMKAYPESEYRFDPDRWLENETVEVVCVLTIKEGENEKSRAMWLPVMDNRNNSLVNPTTRQISDARMRCLVKAMAMFGLGHYIYAGEDIPSGEAPAEATEAQMLEIQEYAGENQIPKPTLTWLEKHKWKLTEEQAETIIDKLRKTA